jgi:recombinational DNA repair ATPase RecF
VYTRDPEVAHVDSHDEWLERINRQLATTAETVVEIRRGVARMADIARDIADSVTALERPGCLPEGTLPPEAI